jgi:hypothetical protein
MMGRYGQMLIIRPTCLFLAAKTTNHPVPIDVFVSQVKNLTQADVLDTEFLVAQSLSFEFWARGAEKALRGWGLELQVCLDPLLHLRPDTVHYDVQALQPILDVLNSCTELTPLTSIGTTQPPDRRHPESPRRGPYPPLDLAADGC